MKIRMLVRDTNDAFVHDMNMHGHHLPFLERPSIDCNNPKKSRTIEQTFNFTNAASATPSKSNHGGLFSGTKYPESHFTKESQVVGTPFPWSKDTSLEPYSEKELETDCDIQSQSISCHPSYRNYSHEELRLSKYREEQKKLQLVSATAPAMTQPLFSPKLLLARDLPPSFPVWGSDNIYNWIRAEVKASRGTELQGTLNPDVLPVLFHKQASGWKDLSKLYFERITVSTLTAMEKC